MTLERAKLLALEKSSLRRLGQINHDLDSLVAISSSDGNWNYSEYLLGMANGVLAARAVVTGKSPDFLSAPEQWKIDEVRKVAPDAVPLLFTSHAEEAKMILDLV